MNRLIAVLPYLLLAGFGLAVARPDGMADLFIYREGARLALAGESPYNDPALKAAVAAQFAGDESLRANCGFFLAPQALIWLAPFGCLAWPLAQVAYAAAVAAVAAVTACALVPDERSRLITSFAFAVNPVTLAVVAVGQTTVFFAGFVAAGWWLWRAGRWRTGVILWSFAFFKPHLAVGLVPLAVYLGGPRPAAWLVAAVAVQNVVGSAVAGRSPWLVAEFLSHVGASHGRVAFNRVEWNPQITGWNRLAYSLTGRAWNLSAAATLTGGAAWWSACVARCAAARTRATLAWALAATAVGALLTSQTLGYELALLVLATPLILEFLAYGRAAAGLALIGGLVIAGSPLEWAEALGIDSHRAWGVLALAVALLWNVPRDPTSEPSAEGRMGFRKGRATPRAREHCPTE